MVRYSASGLAPTDPHSTPNLAYSVAFSHRNLEHYYGVVDQASSAGELSHWSAIDGTERTHARTHSCWLARSLGACSCSVRSLTCCHLLGTSLPACLVVVKAPTLSPTDLNHQPGPTMSRLFRW